jgi:hypothetical protein
MKITIGLVALAVAQVGNYVIQRKLHWPESVADPVSGLLYGVAIGLTLLGIRAQAKALKAKA